MRRRRGDDALWSHGAYLCAAARSGVRLSPQDSAVLDEIARDMASDAYTSPTPPPPCDALAAVGGDAWVRHVNTWMDRLRWSPAPSALLSSGTSMRSEPAAKRPRIDTRLGGATRGSDEPMILPHMPMRLPARPSPAISRSTLPNIPEALSPHTGLFDTMDVASQRDIPETTGVAWSVGSLGDLDAPRQQPLGDVARATRAMMLPDDDGGPHISSAADRLVESDQSEYEERVPLDVQDAIMRRLIATDPQSALGLAGASTRQASLLRDRIERARQRALPETLPDIGQAPGARGDYVRARTAFGGDPRDAPLAIALCLMEAFARFLFDYDAAYRLALRERARSGRGLSGLTDFVRPPTQEYPFLYDSRLVDQVASDPRLGNLRDRARAWYQWINTTAHDGPIQALIEEYAGPLDRYSALPARPLRRARHGTLLGETIGNRFQPKVLGLAVSRRAFEGPELPARIREDLPRPYLASFYRAIPGFGERPEDFLNAGVRRYLRGPCALVASEAPLAMPDFTRVFDVQFIIETYAHHETLFATIRSPAIERLLS